MSAQRTLETVKAMERRVRARLSSAALRSGRVAAQQRLVRGESAGRLRSFAAGRSHCAFSCSIAAARDAVVHAVDEMLAAEAREADGEQARAAAALLPWARLRTGLERLRARQTGAGPR
ncbi:MAG TPA: hypothetical protein VKT51_07020 [Candidatus Eremiobacteraceae bacterium]|nr:hypothetical protein [Candidatus Eremiobacteraceae bacterium]